MTRVSLQVRRLAFGDDSPTAIESVAMVALVVGTGILLAQALGVIPY